VKALADSPLESARNVEATVGVVETAERTDSENSSVLYVPGANRSVSSQSSGVITELSIDVGQPVTNGSSAWSVDGVPVVAYEAAAPLFRDIKEGLSGKDVKIAQQVLADTGFLSGSIDGIAGDVTGDAIAKFNREYGYGKSNRVLGVGSLLWVPEGSGVPTSVTVRVGDSVSPGTEVYVASVEPATISVDVEPVDQQRVVTASGVSVSLPAGQTTVSDPEDVNALAEVVGDKQAFPATVALAEPRTVGTVPASSVVTDAQSRTCFFLDVDGPGIIIEATTGSFGVVDVDPALAGTSVVLNPRAVRMDTSCG